MSYVWKFKPQCQSVKKYNNKWIPGQLETSTENERIESKWTQMKGNLWIWHVNIRQIQNPAKGREVIVNWFALDIVAGHSNSSVFIRSYIVGVSVWYQRSYVVWGTLQIAQAWTPPSVSIHPWGFWMTSLWILKDCRILLSRKKMEEIRQGAWLPGLIVLRGIETFSGWG